MDHGGPATVAPHTAAGVTTVMAVARPAPGAVMPTGAAAAAAAATTPVSYTDVRDIGKGSFGVVFRAALTGSGRVVAIKKVLQDTRFKVPSS